MARFVAKRPPCDWFNAVEGFPNKPPLGLFPPNNGELPEKSDPEFYCGGFLLSDFNVFDWKNKPVFGAELFCTNPGKFNFGGYGFCSAGFDEILPNNPPSFL